MSGSITETHLRKYPVDLVMERSRHRVARAVGGGSEVDLTRCERSLNDEARILAGHEYTASPVIRIKTDLADQTVGGRSHKALETFGGASLLVEQRDVREQLRLDGFVKVEFGDRHRLRQQSHLAVEIDGPDKAYIQQDVRGFVHDEHGEHGRANDVRDHMVLVLTGFLRRPIRHLRVGEDWIADCGIWNVD